VKFDRILSNWRASSGLIRMQGKRFELSKALSHWTSQRNLASQFLGAIKTRGVFMQLKTRYRF